MVLRAQLALDAARIATAIGLSEQDAGREVRLLLAHALQRPQSWIMAREGDPAQQDIIEASPYGRYLDERVNGMPIAYILGQREFYGIEFLVGPGVLIPRPETELLVDSALRVLSPSRPSRALDLGTGSGCIAIALALNAPRTHVLAVDASAAALTMAARNLQQHQARNLGLLASDWYAELRTMRFDLIVSNPPYVEEGDEHLSQGDLRHEPRSALTPGSDGLKAIRDIVAGAPEHLNDGGWLMLEHGYDQAHAVRALLQQQGFADVQSTRDLAGIERISCGRLPGSDNGT